MTLVCTQITTDYLGILFDRIERNKIIKMKNKLNQQPAKYIRTKVVQKSEKITSQTMFILFFPSYTTLGDDFILYLNE